jgi:hypothetical protein
MAMANNVREGAWERVPLETDMGTRLDQFNLMQCPGPAGYLPNRHAMNFINGDCCWGQIIQQEELIMFDLKKLSTMLSFRRSNAEFQRMLEWRLLRGSHQFPGPDGGTCINEAAIVAAGHRYRAVYSIKDLPRDFSPPIAMFALCINDTVSDELRQELLLPFVTRLAGSADTLRIEMIRAQHILDRTLSNILVPALVEAGASGAAERFRSARTPTDLVRLTMRLHRSGNEGLSRCMMAAFDHLAHAGAQLQSSEPSEAAFCIFLAIREIASRREEAAADAIYRRTADILRTALAIGQQAVPDDMAVVGSRMAAVKRETQAALPQMSPVA